MWMRNEIAMREFVFALCVLWIPCSPAIAQVSTTNVPPEQVPSATQTKPVQKEATPQPVVPASRTPMNATATTVATADDFIIGAEDVLEIRVWREPDLTTKAVVRPD